MKNTVQILCVPEQEVVQIWRLLEALHDLLHQPDYREDKAYFNQKVHQLYPHLHTAYYHTVWDWLPKALQNRLIDGENAASDV